MSPDDLRHLLGTPDQTYDGGMFFYDEIDLNLEFEDHRLVAIWTDGPEFRLLGIPLNGSSVERLRTRLQQAGVRYQEFMRLDGYDSHHFTHGLVLESLGDTIERIRWVAHGTADEDHESDMRSDVEEIG